MSQEQTAKKTENTDR